MKPIRVHTLIEDEYREKYRIKQFEFQMRVVKLLLYCNFLQFCRRNEQRIQKTKGRQEERGADNVELKKFVAFIKFENNRITSYGTLLPRNCKFCFVKFADTFFLFPSFLFFALKLLVKRTNGHSKKLPTFRPLFIKS